MACGFAIALEDGEHDPCGFVGRIGVGMPRSFATREEAETEAKLWRENGWRAYVRPYDVAHRAWLSQETPK